VIGVKYLKEKVRLGVIGLGQRGYGELNMILDMPDVEVNGVCDILDFRVRKALELVKSKTGRQIEGYYDYRKLLERSDLDAVVIFTAWDAHIKIAVAAMKAGLYTAMEVGGAHSIDKCWWLVRTY
jgi:predicted dehydrogenase